jgi:hypothetical protein
MIVGARCFYGYDRAGISIYLRAAAVREVYVPRQGTTFVAYSGVVDGAARGGCQGGRFGLLLSYLSLGYQCRLVLATPAGTATTMTVVAGGFYGYDGAGISVDDDATTVREIYIPRGDPVLTAQPGMVDGATGRGGQGCCLGLLLGYRCHRSGLCFGRLLWGAGDSSSSSSSSGRGLG